MYKFFGTPQQEIKSKLSGKILFRFDSLGEFITEDEEIIKRALGFFDYIKLKAEVISEKVAKTVTTPQMTITTKDEEKAKQIKEEIKDEIIDEGKEVKIYKCKHCDFETENKGTLLAHYRTHKKED